MSDTELKDREQAEDDGSDGSDRSAQEAEFDPKEQAEAKRLGFLAGTGGIDEDGDPNEEKKKGLKGFLKSRKGKGALVGGGTAIGVIFMVLFLLSALKVPHFSQVVVAGGYARLNAILRERSSQLLFDAAVVDGPGTATVPKVTLWDRLKGNTDWVNDIKQLGIDNRFNLLNDAKKPWKLRNTGEFDGVRVEGENIRLSDITKELYGVDSYYKLVDPTKKAAVKLEFARLTQTAIGDGMKIGERHVTAASFDRVIAANAGFKWKRWKDKAKAYENLDPQEAYRQNLADSMEDINNKNVVTGIEQVDKVTEEVKLPENLKKFLKKNNKMDRAAYVADVYKANLATAQKVADVASEVGQITLLATMACITNVAFSHIPEIDKNNYDQAEGMSLQLAAAGDQTKWSDVNGPAEGAEAERLENADLSPSYQILTGGVVTEAPTNVETPRIRSKISPQLISLVKGVTSPSRIVTGGATVALAQLPGVTATADAVDAKFCEALLSPEGMIIATSSEILVQAIIGFLTAGGGTLATEGGAKAATWILTKSIFQAVKTTGKGLFSIKSAATIGGIGAYQYGLMTLIDWLSSSSFSGTETGADYLERTAIGTDLRQSHDNRRTLYGRPLTDAETRELDTYAQRTLIYSYQNKGVMQRYFALDNPYSLASAAVASTPGTFTSGVSMFQRGVGNIGSMLSLRTLTRPFMGQASAAGATFNRHSDIVQWDYSLGERQRMASDPSFSLEQNEKIITPKITALDASIGKCFTTESQYDADNLFFSGECSIAKLSTDDALRYRIYKGLDSHIVDEILQPLQPPGTLQAAKDIEYNPIETAVEIRSKEAEGTVRQVGTVINHGFGYIKDAVSYDRPLRLVYSIGRVL